MVYTQKNIKNGLQTLLVGNISNSDTLLTITTGEGGMFPSNNTPLVLEQFNTSGACFKREVVNLVSKSGDILTVSRAYEESVQDDTAIPKTITQNALSFNLDQGIVKISQYMTAKIFDELENEVVAVRTELGADILTAVQKQNVVYGASSTGNDSYAITLSPVPVSYTAGMTLRFLADVANTGVATLNANGLGAKTIKKLNDQDLATGDIEANQIVEVVYNSVDDVWEMTSQIATLPTVDINGLTAFTVPATGDKFIAYDVSVGANGAITYENLIKGIKNDITDKIQFNFSCSSTTRSTNTSSNVTITADAGGITMTPASSQGYGKMLFEIKEFIFSIFSRMNFSMIVEGTSRNSIDSIFVGAGNLTMTGGVPTYLDSHVGFEVYYQAGVGTNIYATVANGTTRTRSATMLLIPNSTPPQIISFYYKYITSADIEFGISADGGGTWTTTNITTNIPSASLAVNTLQYSNGSENTNLTISKLLNLNYFT